MHIAQPFPYFVQFPIGPVEPVVSTNTSPSKISLRYSPPCAYVSATTARRRRGLLDGLCLTGGEPTLQADLAGFCREVKSLGLLVKLDTNGSRPDTVRRLIEAGLIDYVAMDVKNGRERYAETAGVPSLDLGPVEESVALLKEGRVDYEFRTTVVSQLHDEASLVSAAEWLRGAKAWYLQQFVDSGGCIRQGLTAYSEDALRALLKTVQTILPAARLRGV